MANPVLQNGAFVKSKSTANQMTIQGTVIKTFFLLFLAIGAASWSWYKMLLVRDVSLVIRYLQAAGLGGFIIAIFTVFVPKASPITGPLYALVEGIFLGIFSMIANLIYPGIALQALSITFSLLFCMLFLYTTGLLKASRKLQTFISVSLGAMLITMLVEKLLAYFFNIQLGILQGTSLLSIGVSVFLVIVGALSLIMDFYFIEERSKRGVPRYMEWYSAFGLMVSLVWLYLRVLDLLLKLKSRKRR